MPRVSPPPVAFVAFAALLALAETGCSFAPDYVAPSIQAPAVYKETGIWTPAEPTDDTPRGRWWQIYHDPKLDELEQALVEGNPDLAVALSHYDQAQNVIVEARSALLPELDLNGNATRNRQSEHRPLRAPGSDFYGNNLLGASVSYEFDLWGRVRNRVASARAGAQAAEAEADSARLSLEAKLAEAYFALRGLDAQQRLLVDTTQAYARALDLTVALHTGGAVSGLDVGRAQVQLSTARAEVSDVAARRAIREHEIASLIGVPASTFSIEATLSLPPPPVVPTSAPSLLLQRRPDVAAAERRAAAANAEVGVARAAYYPSITLDATGGFQTNGGGVNLLNFGNSFWALGPAFALTVFDNGRRDATVQIAHDRFDEAAAQYRSTALSAFQEVEDELALCNRLADEAGAQAAAVEAASRTEALSLKRYQQGAVNYLDVVVAQTADLQAKRAALDVATRRLLASVDLVRALGGGWTPMQIPL
jgi:multidrug efflux system outer membrane protein